MASNVRITQIKSKLGRQQKQHETLIGLGLRRIRDAVILKNTPEVVGMINKVKHLVKVEAVDEAE